MRATISKVPENKGQLQFRDHLREIKDGPLPAGLRLKRKHIFQCANALAQDVGALPQVRMGESRPGLETQALEQLRDRFPHLSYSFPKLGKGVRGMGLYSRIGNLETGS